MLNVHKKKKSENWNAKYYDNILYMYFNVGIRETHDE